jgi:hypothetical protein
MAQLVKTVQGLAIASVKTAQGLAIASVKTIMGLDNTSGGGGTPTFIQDDGQTFDPFNTARTVTFTSNTTAGSMVIAVYRGGNADELTVTDNNGSTYVMCVPGTASGIAIHAAYNITGRAGHVVTFTLGTTNSNSGDIVVLEYSGMAAASAFDVGAEDNIFTANASINTAAIAQAVELIFGAYSSSATPTAGAGFTLRINQGVLWTEDKNSAAIAAQTVNFVNAEANVSIAAATFKAS